MNPQQESRQPPIPTGRNGIEQESRRIYEAPRDDIRVHSTETVITCCNHAGRRTTLNLLDPASNIIPTYTTPKAESDTPKVFGPLLRSANSCRMFRKSCIVIENEKANFTWNEIQKSIVHAHTHIQQLKRDSIGHLPFEIPQQNRWTPERKTFAANWGFLHQNPPQRPLHSCRPCSCRQPTDTEQQL